MLHDRESPGQGLTTCMTQPLLFFITLCKKLASSLLLGKASQSFACSHLDSEVKVEEAAGGSQSDKGKTRLQ